MARRYSTRGADTNTNNTTIIGINAHATTPNRGKIYDIIIGSRATPADDACTYLIQRITTVGTRTALVPPPLDPADIAASFVTGFAHSAEPTYTADTIMLEMSVNKRTTMRWVASSGGELWMPATANNGYGMLCVTPTTAYAVETTIHFEE